MVRHCMEIIKLVAFLNPVQVNVITGDQPEYALGKKVQWMHSIHYNDTVRVKIDTPGGVENLLDVGKVEWSRYARQIYLATSLNLPNEAFNNQSEKTI